MINDDKQTCKHTGPGINHPVLLLFHRDGQNIREQTRSTGNRDIREQSSSCRGGRPPEASGGIVSHNRRTEFNIQADAPQQLVLEIRDTKKQPDF
jgi:hypothetical protein